MILDAPFWSVGKVTLWLNDKEESFPQNDMLEPEHTILWKSFLRVI